MSDEIVVYQPDQVTRIETRMDGDTVWLTQKQIAALFGRSVPVINRHLKNAQSEELSGISVIANFAITAADGKTYRVKCYNLDAVLSVGYRVKSPRGVQFRQWANGALKERLLRGNALTQGVQLLKDDVSRRFAAYDQAIAALQKRVDELSGPRSALAMLGKADRACASLRRVMGGMRRQIAGRKAPARDPAQFAALVSSIVRERLRPLIGDDLETKCVFVRSSIANVWLKHIGVTAGDVRRMTMEGLNGDFIAGIMRFPQSSASVLRAVGFMFRGSSATRDTCREIPIVGGDYGAGSVVANVSGRRATPIRRHLNE